MVVALPHCVVGLFVQKQPYKTIKTMTPTAPKECAHCNADGVHCDKHIERAGENVWVYPCHINEYPCPDFTPKECRHSCDDCIHCKPTSYNFGRCLLKPKKRGIGYLQVRRNLTACPDFTPKKDKQ